MNTVSAKKAATAKELLDEVRDKFAAAIPGLWDQNRDDIQTAIDVAVEDAQDRAAETESPVSPKLSLSVALKWNLDTRRLEFSMPVTIKRTAKVSEDLDDPSQPELPMEGGEGPGVEITEATRRLAKAIRDGKATVTISSGTTDEDQKRRIAAKVLSLPEDNPELHAEAQRVAAERGIDYVAALAVIAQERKGTEYA